MLPFTALGQKAARVAMIGFAVLCVWQVSEIHDREPNSASGYDVAAQFVVDNAESPIVFFDGHNSGYFIYFMRKFADEGEHFIIRGDKVLSSSSVFTDHWLVEHAQSEQDILKLFDDYAVQYVVVEAEERTGVAIHRTLRRLLETGPFALEKDIPIDAAHRRELIDQDLRVYRYLEPKHLAREYIDLRVAIIGRTIRAPVRKK